MSKEYDVVAIGEILMDFTECGTSPQGNAVFEANPGGAPCNVLAMLQKLGKRTAFIGRVGDDMFGRDLRAAVRESGIDDRELLSVDEASTTLAFVKTLAGGERDFSFCRKPGADRMIRARELPKDMLGGARIFHFGSFSMTHDDCRAATQAAVGMARDAGAVVSFDPNLRPPVWGSLEDARSQIGWGLNHADIVKISDNEVEFMTGEANLAAGADVLRARYPGIRLLCVTAGADGSHAYYGREHVYAPAVKLGGTIEATGAGDTFCGCVLSFVLDHGLEGLSPADLGEMLRFSNAAAYLVTTKKGALRSMPDRADVEAALAAMGE